MANSQILTIALVAIYGATGLSAVRVNITSPPVTNHGQWGKFESCPPGRYAQGFQLKTQSNQFIYDDTALNSIRLFCGDPYDPDTPAITSTIGPFGNWGKIYTCSPGILHGFQLRSEMDLGDGDDTAANNIRFYCSTLPNDHIQGDGLFWGDWTSSQYCHSSQGICGIQTQVEPDLGEGDDNTSLNNVLFECCDYEEKDLERINNDYYSRVHNDLAGLNPKFLPVIAHPSDTDKSSDANVVN